MVRDIYQEVSERYLRPYVDGTGEPHLYPKVRVNLGNTKTLSKETAKGVIWASQRLIRYKYPFAVSDTYTNYIYDGKASSDYSVAIRVNGKWITNRGNQVDKFSVMSLKKARKIIGKLQSFDYAIVKWYVDYIPMFLVRKDIIESLSMEDILAWECHPRDKFVADLIRELAGFECNVD